MENNTLTIAGMTLAFVTGALFPIITELAKNFFEQKSRSRKLRTALYKEIWFNYYILRAIEVPDFRHDKDELREFTRKHVLRTECYQNALKNELSLFYEMKEATEINWLQGGLITKLISLSTDLEQAKKPAQIKKIKDDFLDYSDKFQYAYGMAFYIGGWDKRILKSFMSETEYKNFMSFINGIKLA